MDSKQAELWPGHTDWTASIGRLGHSTHTELMVDGKVRVRVTFGRPGAKEGHTPKHTVSTPQGNYQIPSM